MASRSVRRLGLTNHTPHESLHGHRLAMNKKDPGGPKDTTLETAGSPAQLPAFKRPQLDVDLVEDSISDPDNKRLGKVPQQEISGDSSSDGESLRRRASIKRTIFTKGGQPTQPRGATILRDGSGNEVKSGAKTSGREISSSALYKGLGSQHSDTYGFGTQRSRAPVKYGLKARASQSSQARVKIPDIIDDSSPEKPKFKTLQPQSTDDASPTKKFKFISTLLGPASSPLSSSADKRFTAPSMPTQESEASDTSFVQPFLNPDFDGSPFKREPPLPSTGMSSSSSTRGRKRPRDSPQENLLPLFCPPVQLSDDEPLFGDDDETAEADKNPALPLGSGNDEDVAQLDLQSSPLSPLPDEPDTIPRTTACPLCGDTIAKKLLDEYSKNRDMNVAKQVRFCHYHKRHEASNEYAAAAYPSIQWDALEARVTAVHDVIRDMLDDKIPSFYRNALQGVVDSGKSTRTLRQGAFQSTSQTAHTAEQHLLPGYYGTRGQKLISENLMHTFSAKLRRLAPRDRLMAHRGVVGYVEAVLVPEVATRLVVQDMGLGLEQARQVLRDSVVIGELMNEEAEEDLGRERAESFVDD